MPNREQHELVATIAGGVAGGLRASRRRKRYPGRRKNNFHDTLQVAGTAMASRYSARLADVFEPPTGPCHRGTAHSATVGVWATYALNFIDRMEDACRDAAEKAAEKRRAEWEACKSTGGWECVGHFLKAGWHFILEILDALFSGAPAGVLVGYISHIVLDAGTPASVPAI